MAPFVKDLKDSDIQALAEHYAADASRASDEKIDPAMVERGARIAAQRYCASCHLPTLAGQEQMPRLARQRVDYMITAMTACLKDQRAGAETAMTAAIFRTVRRRHHRTRALCGDRSDVVIVARVAAKRNAGSRHSEVPISLRLHPGDGPANA